jgi:hypothetical protein
MFIYCVKINTFLWVKNSGDVIIIYIEHLQLKKHAQLNNTHNRFLDIPTFQVCDVCNPTLPVHYQGTQPRNCSSSSPLIKHHKGEGKGEQNYVQ